MPIYISKSGQRYGPYSVEEIKRQLEAGRFTLDDFATADTGQSWCSLGGFPEFGPKASMVEWDAPNNLLIIRYCGRVKPAAVRECLEEVERRFETIQPGFRLLVDLTGLESMELSCAPDVEKIMQICNDKGVSAVARVIPDPRRDIGLQIMSYFHYGPEVRIVACATMDDAMKALSA